MNEVEAEPDVNPANEVLRELLFQNARELLLTVVKHAETNVAWVDLKHADEQTMMIIRDLGKGFDASDLPEPGETFGLFPIRERLRPIGGHLEIDSAQTRGARERKGFGTGRGLNWPTTRGHIDDVIVTFTAGYGDAAWHIPEPLRHSILLLVAHWFERRVAAD